MAGCKKINLSEYRHSGRVILHSGQILSQTISYYRVYGYDRLGSAAAQNPDGNCRRSQPGRLRCGNAGNSQKPPSPAPSHWASPPPPASARHWPSSLGQASRQDHGWSSATLLPSLFFRPLPFTSWPFSPSSCPTLSQNHGISMHSHRQNGHRRRPSFSPAGICHGGRCAAFGRGYPVKSRPRPCDSACGNYDLLPGSSILRLSFLHIRRIHYLR